MASDNTNPKKSKGRIANIVTGVGEASFPHLDEPDTKGQYASKKYDITLLWPKEDKAQTKILTDAAFAAALDMWGPEVIKGPGAFKIIINNGDDKGDLGGYRGKWYIRPKSNYKPRVIDGRKADIDAKTIKPGDSIRLKVVANAYEQSIDKEVADALAAQGKPVFRKETGGKVVWVRPSVTWMLDVVQLVKAGAGGGGAVRNVDDMPTEPDAPQAASSAAVTGDDALYK